MDPSPPDININTEDQRQRDVNRSRGHRAEHRGEMIEVAPPRAATPAPRTCLTHQESNQHVQHQQHLLQTSLPDPYFYQRLHPLWFQPHSHLLMMTPRSPQDFYFMNMCPVLVPSLWPPLLPPLPPVYSYQLNAPEHHQLHCPNLNEQQQSLETSKGNYQETTTTTTTTTASVTTSSGINRNTEDDDGDERKLEAGDNVFLEIMIELWSNEASDADIQSILDVEYLDHLLSSLPQPADFMSVEIKPRLDVDAADEPVTDTDSSPLGLAASTDLDSSVSSDPQSLDSVALEEQEQTLQPHQPSAGSSSDPLLRRDTNLRPDGQNTLNTDVTLENFNNCHTGSRFSDFTNFLNLGFDATDEEELSALRPAGDADLNVSEDASTLLSDFLNNSSSTLSPDIQSGCLLGNASASESDGASTSCPAGSNKDSSVHCGDLVEKVHLLTLKTETEEDNSILLNTNSSQLSHEIQNSPLLKDPSASESDQTFCLAELIEDLSVLCSDLVGKTHPPTLKMETKEDILRFLLDFPNTDSTQLSHKIQIRPLLGGPSTSESDQASTSCLAGSNRDTLVPCGDLVPPTLKTETKEDVSIFLNTNSAQLFHKTENSLLVKDPSTSESDQLLAESNEDLSVPCRDLPTLKMETEEDASMFLSDSDSTRLSHKIQNSPLLQDPTTSEPDHASTSCFSGSIQDPSVPDRDLVGKVRPPALKTKTKEDILMRLSYFIKTFSTHKTQNRPPAGDQTTSGSDRASTSCLSESNKDPSVPPPALITETEEDASTFLSNSNTDSTQLSHKVQTGSGRRPDPTSSEIPLVSRGVLVGKIRPETEEHHLIKDPSNTSDCPDSHYPKVVRNSDSEPEKHIIETKQSLETPEGSASPIISSELRTKDRCDIEKNCEENLDKVGRTSVTQEKPATKARDRRVKEITFQSRENKENETKRRRSQRLSSEFKTERAEVKDGVVHETRRSGKRQLCKRAESNCGEQSQGTERSSETQSLEVEEEEKCEAKTSQEEEEDAQRSRSGRVTRSKVRQSEEKRNEASTFPSVKTLRSSSLDQNQTSRSSGLKPSPDQTTDETKRERKRKNEDKSNVPQSRKKKHRSERDVSEETNVFTRNTRSKTKAAAAAAAAAVSTRTRNSQRRLDKKINTKS